MDSVVAVETGLWQRLLRADEEMQRYFARRTIMNGATVFTCSEAPEFNVAIVDGVDPDHAGDVLAAVVSHFRERRAVPRVRLSPVTHPGWVRRLRRAGFVETGERRTFWLVPDQLRLPAHPQVTMTRVTTRAQARLFSSIQGIGFELSPAVQDWDLRLTRRHLTSDHVRFFLGWLDGAATGTVATTLNRDGPIGIWGLATLPLARRRGVASTLLRQAINEARATSAGPLFLTTAWDNPSADLYAKLGFVALFHTRSFILP